MIESKSYASIIVYPQDIIIYTFIYRASERCYPVI